MQSGGPAADDTSAASKRGWQVDGILYLSARSTGLGLERIYADVGGMLGEPTASRLAVRWADRDTLLAAKGENHEKVFYCRSRA